MPALTLATLTLLSATATLPGNACVAGRVSDPEGRPVARAAISVFSRLAGGALRSTDSDRNGQFQLASLAEGPYWLVVERFGFEPEIRTLELHGEGASGEDLRLSPMALLLERAEGAAELPWLLRAFNGDPTRFTGTGATTAVLATPLGFGRPVAGRVGWNALSGDAALESEGSGIGKRTELALGGALRQDMTWRVDGRTDSLGASAEGAHDLVESQAVRVGLDYGTEVEGLRFEGELKRARREIVDRAEASDIGERRASYALSFRSGGPEKERLDVSLGYRASEADGNPLLEAPSQSHAMLEGHGDYALLLGEGLRLRSRLSVRAQHWSSPNQNLLAETAPRNGMVLDGRFLSPRTWDFDLSESMDWQLAGALKVQPGVDVARASGDGAVPLLRPRLGAELTLGPGARLRGDLSWAFDGDGGLEDVAEPDTGVGALGFRFGFEQELGADAYLRIAALRNGYRDLDRPAPRASQTDDYLLFARGAVRSHELRVDLRAPPIRGVAGFASVAAGQADGDLAYVPLAYASPGGSLLSLGEGPVRFASASLGGAVLGSATELVVRYRALRAGNAGSDYERIDVELEQGLPWWGLLGARLDLLLAISDYLRRPASFTPAATETLPFEPAPVLAAGVGVRF